MQNDYLLALYDMKSLSEMCKYESATNGIESYRLFEGLSLPLGFQYLFRDFETWNII